MQQKTRERRKRPGRLDALRSMGRAFAHRNYRLYFAGQAVSLIGGWITRVATGWLVFRLSGADSAFLLGFLGFAGQIPCFFLSPFAGVFIDRWDRRRLLLVTQTLFMSQSSLLALVAFLGEPGMVTIWLIVAISVFEGLINTFDMPARQAFLTEIVTRKEDQANAIALNSSLMNGTRLVGPAIAGVLIAAAGEAWCFVVDATCTLGILAALLAMRVNPRQRIVDSTPVLPGLIEGFRYAFGFAPIRTFLLLVALASLMAMPYSVLMPIFAVDILHGGAATLGYLTTAAGIGALLGALFLASRSTVLGLGRIIVWAATALSLGLIVFGLSQSLWLSLAALVIVGFGMMVQLAASNTILQTIVEEDKRGRVMSFYGMAFLGITPFGSLFAGIAAGVIGAGPTVVVGGCACLCGALWFALRLPRVRTLVRPIYRRHGILPALASGVESATELTRPPEWR